MRPRRTIIETGAALHPIALYPLGGGLGRHLESSCSGLQRPRLFDDLLNQPLSTAKAQSGILVNVHSIGPRKLDCSSQSASRVPLEWTTSWKDRGQPERCKSRRATSAPWKSVPLISTFAPLRRLRYCSPSQKEQRLERSQVPHVSRFSKRGIPLRHKSPRMTDDRRTTRASVPKSPQ